MHGITIVRVVVPGGKPEFEPMLRVGCPTKAIPGTQDGETPVFPVGRIVLERFNGRRITVFLGRPRLVIGEALPEYLDRIEAQHIGVDSEDVERFSAVSGREYFEGSRRPREHSVVLESCASIVDLICAGAGCEKIETENNATTPDNREPQAQFCNVAGEGVGGL